MARVLRYAWKNKQPRFRSAFTYQDHTKPSRIEFAKERFGGPFTTEQVQDVKTFLRIVVALVPIGGSSALGIFMLQTAALFSQHINSNNIPCYAYQAMNTYMPYFTIMCAVPLYEFLVHPVMYNYIPTSLIRFGLGFIIQILSCIALLTIDFVGHGKPGGTNSTCVYDESMPVSKLHVNPLWTMLPQSLVGLGIFFNFTSIPITFLAMHTRQ